jgi:hypothetical protein
MPIPNDQKNRERMRQSSYLPKPGKHWYDEGSPESMGLYRMQINKSKRKSGSRKKK